VDAEADLLDRARAGDEAAFEQLVAGHHRELLAHGYRMLGSPQDAEDAEDAVQESLLAAWRGLPGFAGRSSLRTWLYRICTNACLRVAERRRRVLSPDHGPARSDPTDLGAPVPGPVFLEPWLDEPVGSLISPEPGPDARYLHREGVELAFVAALQHLPGVQRAVLILREVLEFPAAQVADILDTTPAAVNSALQRARKVVAERVPARSQQAELAALGADGQRQLVAAFVAAWERADVPALVELLAEDARFTMPPLPAWFDGRPAVVRFLAERVFETPWRLVPLQVNAQPAFACYQDSGDGRFRLGAINVLSVRDGRIVEISGFLDPAVHAAAGLAEEISAGAMNR
jgi:RNA polymerase sigma-70 factor (TIGR02960 family)